MSGLGCLILAIYSNFKAHNFENRLQINRTWKFKLFRTKIERDRRNLFKLTELQIKHVQIIRDGLLLENCIMKRVKVI